MSGRGTPDFASDRGYGGGHGLGQGFGNGHRQEGFAQERGGVTDGAGTVFGKGLGMGSGYGHGRGDGRDSAVEEDPYPYDPYLDLPADEERRARAIQTLEDL